MKSFLIVSWILIVATLVYFILVPRTDSVDQVLNLDPEFDQALEYWETYPENSPGDEAVVTLKAPLEGELRSVRQWFEHPGSTHLEVTIRWRTLSEKSAHGMARADLYTTDSRDQKPVWFLSLFSVVDASPWQQQAFNVDITEAAQSLQIELEVTGTGIVLELDSVVVKPAMLKPWDDLVIAALTTAWLIVAAALIRMLVIRAEWSAIAGLLCVLLLLVLLPESAKLMFKEMTGEVGWIGWDHFLPMLLFGLCYRVGNFRAVDLGFLITVAVALETLQWLVPHREPLLQDSLSNIAGVLVGYLIVERYQRLLKTENHR